MWEKYVTVMREVAKSCVEGCWELQRWSRDDGVRGAVAGCRERVRYREERVVAGRCYEVSYNCKDDKKRVSSGCGDVPGGGDYGGEGCGYCMLSWIDRERINWEGGEGQLRVVLGLQIVV